MRSKLYETVRRPSVCPSVPRFGRGGFAAVGPAAREYRHIAASPALSNTCEQRHVVSRRTRLTNTDVHVCVSFTPLETERNGQDGRGVWQSHVCVALTRVGWRRGAVVSGVRQ